MKIDATKFGTHISQVWDTVSNHLIVPVKGAMSLACQKSTQTNKQTNKAKAK